MPATVDTLQAWDYFGPLAFCATCAYLPGSGLGDDVQLLAFYSGARVGDI